MRMSKIKILIVDDDQDDILMLSEGLNEILPNYHLETAGNGVECINKLQYGFKPDVVFLDLNMPLMNGLECLRDIKEEKIAPGIPFIVYSTSDNKKDMEAASEYGARLYLVKPGSYTDLIQSLKTIFSLLQSSNDFKYQANCLLPGNSFEMI